jgi:phosphoribosyl 1,2-cyclic phosphodiesterase
MGLVSFGSGSKGNSHLLTVGNTRILLDAGIAPKKMNISKLEMTTIDGVLLSHEHFDHAKYAKDFINMAIDCYMTQGTKDALGIDSYRIRTIQADKTFKIKDCKITAFQSFHDAAEPVNFLVEYGNVKLVYITDTAKAPYKIKGLTHIMIEANYDKEILLKNTADGKVLEPLMKRIIKTHLSIDGAIKFLTINDLSSVGKIYLIHLSDANSDAEAFKNRVEKLTGKETYIL